MLRPGSRNLITDVDGILVGNQEDRRLRSGVSVVLCETPSTASVDVRGGAPGTRETDLLDPSCLVERVDAICLSGGSAFGLSSSDGVMRWLREHGRGLAIAGVVVPIVPTASAAAPVTRAIAVGIRIAASYCAATYLPTGFGKLNGGK